MNSRRALGKGLEAIFSTMGTAVANPKTGNAVLEIELASISPNPFQPRKEFSAEDVRELADSVEKKGLLQPILLRAHGSGFQIVAGERRFRAYQLLKRDRIPAFVRDRISDRDMMEMALVENIQRVQLNPIEEAMAYEQLADNCGLTHEDIASQVGKSRVAITNGIRLLKLEPQVRQWLSEGKLTAGHGRALLQTPGAEQVKRARNILEAALNVRDAEKQKPGPRAAKVDPNVRAFLEEMRQLLGMKVSLRGGVRKGVIEIHYLNRDDVDNLIQLLRRGRGEG